MDKKKRELIYKYFIGILFISMPFLNTFIQSLIAKENLFLGRPHNSDEFCYWRVLYSFCENGFDFASTCGYVGTDAIIGPLGEHGISTLFAWVGILFRGSVNAHTIFLYNLISLSIALFVLYVLIRPNYLSCISIVLLILLNAVVEEQWYSHMMEIPCISVIIICLTIEIKYRQTEKNIWLLLGIIASVWASYMRICYILLFVPFLCDFWLKKSTQKKKKIISLILFLAVSAGIRFSQTIFMKNSVSFLTELSEDISAKAKIGLILHNSQINLLKYFSYHTGTMAEVGERYLQIVIIIVLIVLSVIKYREEKKYALICLTNAFSMLVLITSMIVLYDISDWRDVRTTMPFTIGIMVWIVCSDEKIKLSLVLVMSTLILQGYPAYEELSTNHPSDRFDKCEYNEQWMNSLKNDKNILCLYNANLDSKSMFSLYENIPSKIGILTALDIDDLNDLNIMYVITTEELDNNKYKLLETSDRYGYIYVNSNMEKRINK